MLEMKKGVDILSDVGGLKTIDEARKVFEANLDSANLAKISKIKNEEAPAQDRQRDLHVRARQCLYYQRYPGRRSLCQAAQHRDR